MGIDCEKYCLMYMIVHKNVGSTRSGEDCTS